MTKRCLRWLCRAMPGRFAMMETANNAGAAMQLPGIEERMNAFAERIRETLLYR